MKPAVFGVLNQEDNKTEFTTGGSTYQVIEADMNPTIIIVGVTALQIIIAVVCSVLEKKRQVHRLENSHDSNPKYVRGRFIQREEDWDHAGPFARTEEETREYLYGRDGKSPIAQPTGRQEGA